MKSLELSQGERHETKILYNTMECYKSGDLMNLNFLNGIHLKYSVPQISGQNIYSNSYFGRMISLALRLYTKYFVNSNEEIVHLARRTRQGFKDNVIFKSGLEE